MKHGGADLMGHDRINFIARLPDRMFWPVCYALHGANELGWRSIGYPLAIAMLVLLLLSAIVERVVPAARSSNQ
jgi:hypothetical protein